MTRRNRHERLFLLRWLMPGDTDIIDELAYMAQHPASFTKAEMAAMMKSAVETIRADRALIAQVRADIKRTAESLAQFEEEMRGAIMIKPRTEGDA